MKEVVSLRELVRDWTGGKFLLRSGFYAGRGPSLGDLNSKILTAIYQGIKRTRDDEAATNFVRFVNQLNDLSAASFIVAFEKFWERNCEIVSIEQSSEDRIRLDGHGQALEVQAVAAVVETLFGRQWSAEDVSLQSIEIKWEFIKKFKKLIPPEEVLGSGRKTSPYFSY